MCICKKTLVCLTTVQFLITVQHVVNVEVCDTIRSIWNVARTSICWLPFLMQLMTWLCPATISGLAPPLEVNDPAQINLQIHRDTHR